MLRRRYSVTLYRLGFGFSRSFSQMQTRKGLSKTSALPLKAETKSFMSSPPGEKVTTLKYFVSRFPSSSKLRRKEAASGASSALFDLRFIGGSAYRCQSMFANRTGGTLYGLPKRTYL